MEGYYRDPVKSAEALDADGWLHTGDLYTRSVDGRLIFNGRAKDMLKVGGENVAAIEVEAYLCSHPAVRIAEVVGRPDPRERQRAVWGKSVQVRVELGGPR